MTLSSDEQTRYSRQIGPGVLTWEGQQRLKESTALISRVGGMGGPAALMLTMAGVGKVILAHGGDLISPDLNRQVLGCEGLLGKPRADGFADYLRSMNRFVEVEAIGHEPEGDEAIELARRADIVLACPPTFEERLRLNQAACTARIPFIDAAQWGMSGSLMVVRPGATACLACIYPTAPPFEELFPVVGAISSAMGSLAALEAIKILSGIGKPLWGKLLTYDGFHGRTHFTDLRRNTECPVCGEIESEGDRKDIRERQGDLGDRDERS